MSRLQSLLGISLCAAALSLMSCSGTNGPLDPTFAPGSPSGTVNIVRQQFVDEFVDAEFFDDCNGEVILVTGALKFRQMLLSTPTGFHRTFQIILHAVGVGRTSGIVYTVNDTRRFTLNFNPRSANVTEIINVFLISRGVATNLAFQVEAHATRSASGEITVDFEKVRFVCRGA